MMTRLIIVPALILPVLFAGIAALALVNASQSWTIRYTVRGWSFWSVHLVDLDRRLTLTVIPETAIANAPTVAPDNRAAAWDRSGLMALWDDLDTEPRELGPGDNPAWSPAGNQLVYHSAGILQTIAPGDAEPRQLVSFRFNDFGMQAEINPVWSPNGESLALRVTYRNSVGIIRGADVFTISAQGLRQRKIGGNTFTMAQIPAWSPDSETLVISALNEGERRIYTLSANGLRQQQRVNFAFPVQSLTWSPDGSRIAFASEATGIRGIYVLELADNRVRGPLEHDFGLSARGGLAWSPDSRALAFVASDRRGIFTLSVDDGLPRSISNPDGYTELLLP